MAEVVDWRVIYQRYTRLERNWSVRDAPEPVARQFFRTIVHGHRTKSAILQELRAFGLEAPAPDILGEAFFLRSALNPSDGDDRDRPPRPAGRHFDDPLEDVYAAALSMLPHGFWVESPERTQLYRGQRDAKWPTIPKLFRSEDVRGALDKLAHAIPRIRACLPGLSEEQAVATAQHYAKELDVATWLLDMTYDPRVALFFASDGGVAGDIGVVNCVVQKEWQKLSAAGTNRLGRLHVIDVPGVLRIEHQRASFLDTSHPDLFDQYVAHTVWFRQKDGLRFEDPEAAFPVTGDSIYPSADPFLTALSGATPAAAGALQIGPAGDAREPLDSTAYLEISQSWCRQEHVEIDAYHEDTLKVVCDVHADLQTRRNKFALPDRSLARLRDAVDLIVRAQRSGETITPTNALRWSLSRLPPDSRALLEEIIVDCTRARDLC